VSDGAFGYCKYVCLLFLLEYMFDAKTCDVSFLSIERLS
jgi:hypothetical protein